MTARGTVTGGSGSTNDRVTTRTTTLRAKPDLSIGFPDEPATAYAGINYYSTANDPLEWRDGTVMRDAAGPTATAKYRVRLKNFSAFADTFRVRALPVPAPTGLSVAYFTVSGTALTDKTIDFTSTNGYVYPSALAGGGFADIEIQVTANSSALLNAVNYVYLTAYNTNDATLADRVTTRTIAGNSVAPSSFKADSWIKRDLDTTAVGNNIYYGDAGVTLASQKSERAVTPRSGAVTNNNRATYVLTVQNDGVIRERFSLTALAGGTAVPASGDWNILDDDTKVNISAAVRAGTYLTPVVQPQGLKNYRITISAPDGAATGLHSDLTFTTASATAPASADCALLQTWIGNHAISNADGWVRRDSDTASVGDNLIYGQPNGTDVVDANDQMAEGSVLRHLVTTDPLTTKNRMTGIATIQNDGPVLDRFRFVINTSGGNFTNANLVINDVTGGGTIGITTEALAGTYTTPLIAPGGIREYRFQLTVPDNALLGVAGTTTIRILSLANPGAEDRVFVRATPGDAGTASFKPDLLIRRAGEATSLCVGDGLIYGLPKPANKSVLVGLTDQMAEGSVLTHASTDPPVTAANRFSSIVTVQNDGLIPDRYVLSVTTSGGTAPSNFTNGNLVVTDVTDAAHPVTVDAVKDAAGYTTPSIPRAGKREYQFTVTVPDGAAAGAVGSSTVKVISATDSAAQDRAFIRTDVAVQTGFRPDVWLSRPDDTTPNGDDVYFNTDPAQGPVTSAGSLSLASVVATRPAGTTATDIHKTTFIITLQNDGIYPDRLKLIDSSPGTVPITDTDVAYYDVASGAPITAEVNGSGWFTPTLVHGATREVQLVVTAPAGAAPGTAGTRTLIVSSEMANTKQDRTFPQVSVQGVSKIQYSLNEGTTWVDVPQVGQTGYPLTVNQGTVMDFKAIKALPAQPWPQNRPIWTGDYWYDDEGDSVWGFFDDYSVDSNDLFTLNAECGNNLDAKIKVNPRYAVYLFDGNGDEVNLNLLAGGTPSALATANLWAQVVDKDGVKVPGATVNFSATYTDGAQAGQINTPVLTDDSAVTDSAYGIATVILKSGAKLGDVFLQASTQDPSGATIVSGGYANFAPPRATVEFGLWTGTQVKSIPCTVTILHKDAAVAGRSIALRLTVTDAAGNAVATAYTNAAHLAQATGIVDSNGKFTTNLVWTPPTSDPNANPAYYNITVHVDDALITQ